jgi:hypothetical protein
MELISVLSELSVTIIHGYYYVWEIPWPGKRTATDANGGRTGSLSSQASQLAYRLLCRMLRNYLCMYVVLYLTRSPPPPDTPFADEICWPTA